MPIFDQGYQHWDGELGGRFRRLCAITRHGVRTGAKNRWLRTLLLVAWTPALVMTVMLCMWGLLERQSALLARLGPLLAVMLSQRILTDPRHYRVEVWTLAYHYFLAAELWFSMIVILFVGPNLISGDLRFNALPLYFSRPLRRVDYFLGKLGIIFAFMAMVVIVPSIIAYILGLAFSLDITILRDTFPILLSSIAYGLIITVSAGLLVLAMSALTRSSRYVALMWIGLWIVSSVSGAVLDQAQREQRQHAYFKYVMATRPIRRARANPRTFKYADPPDFEKTELEASQTDWRPAVSYTQNLSRLGDELLGTQATWAALSKLAPPAVQTDVLLAYEGPQYPWAWSAGILAALAALSMLILNFTVKSLDRLK